VFYLHEAEDLFFASFNGDYKQV